MSIDLRQLNQIELSGFVSEILDSSYASLMAAYLSTGSVGENVLYITPTSQTVSGQKSFVLSPNIPYTGGTGQAVSLGFVLDRLADFQLQGIQTFQGGTATDFFLVPPPTSGTGSAVNLGYLESLGLLNNTGDQIISGNNTFTGLIHVPTASSGWQAVPYNQFNASGLDFLSKLNLTGESLSTRLNALEAASTAVSQSFQGVLSFNGQRGNIFAQGKGNVTTLQQGNILVISGDVPTGTGYLRGEQGPMGPILSYRGSWATGVTYSFLDWVNQSGISWVSLTGHNSTNGNIPATTGTNWGLLASGNGPSGPAGVPSILFNWKGNWRSDISYSGNDAVFMSGSAFGFTGTGTIIGSGNRPILNSGWSLVVQATPIDENAFYPRTGNPSNFIIDSGQVVKTGMTGQFSPTGHSHPYVTSLNGLIGDLNVTGAGGLSVVQSGSNIFLSGNGAGSGSALNFKGEWNNSTTYPSGSVTYTKNTLYIYLGQTDIAGSSSNPVSVTSKWTRFGEKQITFNTGVYNPFAIYRRNDLAKVISADGVVTEYISNANYSYPTYGLHPSGYYNLFVDCDANTGKNLLEISTGLKAASHPNFNRGSTSGFFLNQSITNQSYLGFGAFTLIRGEKYYFDSEITGASFILTTDPSGGSNFGQYIVGVSTGTRCVADTGEYTAMTDGTSLGSGTLLFQPTSGTPNVLYYQSSSVSGMGYQLNIVDRNPWEIFVSGGIGKTGPTGARGEAGVVFGWKGNWSASELYVPNDAVYHNGGSWATQTYVTHLEPLDNSIVWFPIAKSGMQGSTGPSGQNGLAFAWKGNWSVSVGYNPQDAVYFQGSSYATATSASGITPTGTGTPWFIVAKSGSKGETGAGLPGLAFAWKGDWSSALNYNSGEAVYYEGSSYGTQATTSGQAPPLGPWKIIAKKGGSIFSWRGDFSTGTQYYGGDSVYYNGSSYATLSRSTGGYPDNSTNWFLVAAKGEVGPSGSGVPGKSIMFYGDWNAASTYASGDLVNYGKGTYISTGIATPSDFPPLTPWSPFGNHNALFTWRGSYSPSSGYQPYDSVAYLGNSWATLSSPSGVNPTGSAAWFIIAQGSDSPLSDRFNHTFSFSSYSSGNGANQRVMVPVAKSLNITGASYFIVWADPTGAGGMTVSGQIAKIDSTGGKTNLLSFAAVKASGTAAQTGNLSGILVDGFVNGMQLLDVSIPSAAGGASVVPQSVSVNILGYYS